MAGMDFKEFIRGLRDSKRFSQSGIGDYLGFHYNTISRWERGLQRPKNEQLKRISKVTGVSFPELWMMANSEKSPFIVPVYELPDLNIPVSHMAVPTFEENSFVIIVNKSLEKDSKSVFKAGSYLLLEPHQSIESGDWLFQKNKLRKAKRKTSGMRVCFEIKKL